MYVVTGAAGFIGSCFVAKLNAEGIKDLLLVDESGKTEISKNLKGKLFSDLINKETFRKSVSDNRLPNTLQAVVHMGACSSTTEKNVEFMMDNNYRYTLELAEWCVRNHVRFIYASSAATYGDGKNGYDDDDKVTPRLSPLNVYGNSKQLFDVWALESGNSKKMAGLKFFNVFGPNEYHKEEMRSVVLKAFLQIQAEGKVKLFKSHIPEYKDGEQCRDFVYVKDCVEVMWWLLKEKSVNGIFNLGSGKARTWLDLTRAVFAALEKKEQIEFIDMPDSVRNQYQYFTEARMDKLRKAGYKAAFTSLEDAVRDYVTNYLAKGAYF